MWFKAMASIHAAILFAIIASPATYGLTQGLFGGLFKVASNGTPTVAGLLLHALVFGLVTYAIMWLKRPSSGCGCGSCYRRQGWARAYDMENDEEMHEDMEDDVYEDDMEDDSEDDMEDMIMYEDDMDNDEEYSYEGAHLGWPNKVNDEYASV
jgi:hypothetical protein